MLIEGKVGKKKSQFEELEQVWVVKVVDSKKQEDYIRREGRIVHRKGSKFDKALVETWLEQEINNLRTNDSIVTIFLFF